MRNYPDIGVQVGEILLPDSSVDLEKWAVIACDQYTSQPDYWQAVEKTVGCAPSSLNLILPEVYLGTDEEPDRIQRSQQYMRQYLDNNLLVPYHGMIYVERTVSGKTRRGLMMALDLEHYDFRPGSQSLIRATEGTILDRLPPRIRIREGAPLELPHILVLIDDPERTVIEPLQQNLSQLNPLYDTRLMGKSGHLRGYLVNDVNLENEVVNALRGLTDPQRFRRHYQVGDEYGVLLFAAGDGNHSLATAKSMWEKIKQTAGMDHPARYALVEVENVHDEGLSFEPIHRVLFMVKQDWQAPLQNFFGGQSRIIQVSSPEEMIRSVNQPGGEQRFGVISEQGAAVVSLQQPPSTLAAGSAQAFLDHWMEQGGAEQIDYVHGSDILCNLGSQPRNLGLYLPAMDKSDLFKTVILDGSLPRKTFSMGEAHEKRFYMESRRIA